MTADGSRPGLNAPSPDLIARLTEIVGAEHALTDPDQQLPFLREMRDVEPPPPPSMVWEVSG